MKRQIFLRIVGMSLFLMTNAVSVNGLLADGPADNMLENVRPIPPEGVPVSDDVLKELSQASKALSEKIAAVKNASPEDRAQVEVFARAVRMTVEDKMFYTDKEVQLARDTIALGEARLASLSAGKKGAALIGTSDSSSDKPQLVVGGFRSRLDGSIQPYGLVLPAGQNLLDAKPRRLDVWLHGRGEKTSEVAFLNQRLKTVGEFAPENTIVLHPYGRYCNAFRFAGEVDVLEAIAHVKQLYAIDIDRINIRGFSMGGAGCWQMAVHYPGKWMAATPGAGFSETQQFLKVFQKEDFQPTPIQQSLLHWYDCPEWSNNLKNLPTVAYSGEIDNQKQAADVMEAAMKSRGLTLKHLIGPQTAHKLHPDSKVEIEQFLQQVAQKGRPSVPTNIDFTTFTLRYPTHTWITLEALEEHWREARIQAEIESANAIKIKTQNISAFAINFPANTTSVSRSGVIAVSIDGSAPININATAPGSALESRFVKSNGQWQRDTASSTSPSTLRKRPGLQGPIDDAFLSEFVFVGPQSSDANSSVDKWIAAEFEHAKREWRRQFRGDIVSKTAAEITPEISSGNNLILFGTPQTNPLIAKLANRIPLAWNTQSVTIGSHSFSASDSVPVLIYPNPDAPNRYIVINSGFTYREYAYLNNARQIAMLPDWAILSAKEGRNMQMPGKILTAGFFDEKWQVKK